MNAVINVQLTVPPNLSPEQAGTWLRNILTAAGQVPDVDDEELDLDEIDFDPGNAATPKAVPLPVTAMLKRWAKWVITHEALPGWLIDMHRELVDELLALGCDLEVSTNKKNSYIRVEVQGVTALYLRSTSASWPKSLSAYGDQLEEGERYPLLDLPTHQDDAVDIVLNAVQAFDPYGTGPRLAAG